jgi:hypothetical protein
MAISRIPSHRTASSMLTFLIDVLLDLTMASFGIWLVILAYIYQGQSFAFNSWIGYCAGFVLYKIIDRLIWSRYLGKQ